MTNIELTLDQLEAISGGINRQPHPNMPKPYWMRSATKMRWQRAFTFQRWARKALSWHRGYPISEW